VTVSGATGVKPFMPRAIMMAAMPICGFCKGSGHSRETRRAFVRVRAIGADGFRRLHDGVFRRWLRALQVLLNRRDVLTNRRRTAACARRSCRDDAPRGLDVGQARAMALIRTMSWYCSGRRQ
jgi:hypothetical protein